MSKALSQAPKVCKAFPTVAHIQEIANQIKAGPLELEAEGALAELDKLVARWGVDRAPEFVGLAQSPDGFARCPEITGALGHALASVGGWRVYASRDERSSPFLRRDILAAYKRARDAEAAGWSLIDSGGGEMAGEIAAVAAGKVMR